MYRCTHPFDPVQLVVAEKFQEPSVVQVIDAFGKGGNVPVVKGNGLLRIIVEIVAARHWRIVALEVLDGGGVAVMGKQPIDIVCLDDTVISDVVTVIAVIHV